MLPAGVDKKYLITIKLFPPNPLILIPSSFVAMSTYLFRYGLGAAARHLKVTSRCYASQAAEKDLVVIGGGVAGYVAAIKAGQEGLNVH
jgi:NADPH-dependent 2,4-dienoyl-CoA reductase/sulfur reductase-like enzyme